ncbi:MAG: holo-ACP synthase [Dehalococcoidales bacterium]|jgi:holo-[acyl-carrier-protein] synthase|nr:holo-ACP synthase [Dehalococcoidales bacterium]MDD3994469.1 holo-ACP synthase [Dehalococcoidales bacterium]NLT28792.1 holo-ACP synthase [Dehalococcoidales bacterium]
MQQVGVDIIEINRIEKAVLRWGNAFLNRIYTDSELQLYKNKPASLAARFSGKEAVIKAIGSKRVAYRDIEIVSDDGGKPRVNLYGNAQKTAKHLGIDNFDISLSHCREYAVAFAVTEICPVGGVPPNAL